MLWTGAGTISACRATSWDISGSASSSIRTQSRSTSAPTDWSSRRSPDRGEIGLGRHMKIVCVTQPGHAVLPAAGSIEIWADNVARRLAPRHAVTVYASGAPSQPATDSRNGITYRLISHQSSATLLRLLRVAWRVPPPTRPFFASTLHPRRYWIDVAKEARRQDDEVVHVFNYSQALPVLRRFTDAKLVLHMHCEWLTQLDEKMIERRLRHADLIVGCSEDITDKIKLRFPQHADRCITIYNGVSTVTSPAREVEKTSVELLNVGRVS